MNAIDKPTPKSPKDPLRYRAYFWLMDAAFVASVIVWLAFILLQTTGISAFGLPPLLQTLLALILWPLVAFAPFFLLIARFMRDEYAEGIWRRSVVVLAYAAAILPMAYFLTAWGTFFAAGQPEEPPAIFAWSIQEVSWGFAIWAAFSVYMQIFVFIFQFLRWRDSR